MVFWTPDEIFFEESCRIFINIGSLADACTSEWVEVSDYDKQGAVECIRPSRPSRRRPGGEAGRMGVQAGSYGSLWA